MGSEAKIVELLTQGYGVDAARISPDARFVDLGLDSLRMAELIYDLEDAFGIEIALAGVRIATLGEAIALVDRLIAAKGG